MGAQSVTGKGVGSAEGMAKGPKERNFVGVEKLIGPRVMAAGKVTLSAQGTATVDFANPLPCVAPLSAAATPPTPQADYVILFRDETTTANNAVVVLATVNSNATGDTTVGANLKTCLKGFTLASGTAADVIAWTIIKVGN